MAINVWGAVNKWTLVEVRALTRFGGFLRVVSDGEVGTGLKPIVLVDGLYKERSATEGIPVVYDNGFLRFIRRGEALVI